MHRVAVIFLIIAFILYTCGMNGQYELAKLGIVFEIIAWIIDYLTKINEDDNMD